MNDATPNMEPVHTIEYELSSALASEVHRKLLRWELRRGWRRDMPTYLGAGVFTALIVWLGLEGLIQPGVGVGLVALVAFFVLVAMVRRSWRAHSAVGMALLALNTGDRRARVEFADSHVRMDTEYFRGEGQWTELDEAVVFDRFWILQLSNGGHILLPRPLVSPELEAFIRTKAQEVMAPIHQAL